MIRSTLLTPLLVLGFATSLVSLKAQKYSNEFLSIGPSARAQAMGGAVVSGQQDIFSAAWNPAGLAGLSPERGLEIGAMHAEWFGGVGNFDFLGVSLPLNNNNQRIGLSLIRFGIDQIPNTLTLYESDGTINFDNVVEFSAVDYAFLGTYARTYDKGKGPLRLGGNVKVVHRRIGPFATSWGFGLDLGAQLVRGNWTFGVLARDITTTFNAWSFSFTEQEQEILEVTNNSVPINSVETTNPTLMLGALRRFQFNEKIRLDVELDLIVTTDGQRNTLLTGDPFSLDPALGLEASYGEFVFLRAGVSQFQQIPDFDGTENLDSKPSLGLGLKVGQLFVDYAYTDLGDDRATYSHVISARLGIKPRQR